MSFATTRAAGRALPAGVLLLLMLLLVVVTAAAGSANAAEPAPGRSWVRVGHFVPGMGTASVELEPLDRPGARVTLAGRAAYGDVTSYEKLAPGRYTATVRDSAAPTGSEPLLSRSVDLSVGGARTVAVLGTVGAPRLVLLDDELTPPTAGTARVRLLSASPAADAVTVQAVGGPTIAEAAVLGQATSYATVPAGSWTLELRSTRASATAQDVPVASGSVYTIVVLDDGSDGVRLEVVTDAAGAVVAPTGGARTGLGGTAVDDASPSMLAAAGFLTALLMVVVGALRWGRRWALGPS